MTQKIELDDLGYTKEMELYRHEQQLDTFEVGRVVSEHKERYMVRTENGEYESELIGNLRFTAQSRTDLPAVGDWVAIFEYDSGKALIHAVYPRKSLIERQAVGSFGEKQIIASNIDCGLIVQAVNRDFSINRLERYLTICHASKIEAVILLSKIDLLEEPFLNDIVQAVEKRIRDIPIFSLSNETGEGLAELKATIQKGKTYCLLGSSGVGKSTLLNTLSGQNLMQTDAISTITDRGKHVTSHRELFVLNEGGIVIDNPGMREVGMADNSEGIERTFDEIYTLAENCRFKDCTHSHEQGCAVLEALETGNLDSSVYENFKKLEREQAHFNSTVREKKEKDKNFGKHIRKVKEQRKKNKF